MAWSQEKYKAVADADRQLSHAMERTRHSIDRMKIVIAACPPMALVYFVPWMIAAAVLGISALFLRINDWKMKREAHGRDDA